MELLLVIIELIAADLILGGDNAVVISMATKNLPTDLQLKASMYGALAAIGLRVIFIIVVIKFGEMHISLLNIVAGVLLIKVAYDLITNEPEEHQVSQSSSLIKAIKSIVIADAVMSFDNAVVIASIVGSTGYSHLAQLVLVVCALLVSFPIIIFGAQILTKVIEKYNFVVYIFGVLLIHIAIELIIKDHIFAGINLHISHGVELFGAWILSFVIFAVVWYRNLSQEKHG